MSTANKSGRHHPAAREGCTNPLGPQRGRAEGFGCTNPAATGCGSSLPLGTNPLQGDNDADVVNISNRQVTNSTAPQVTLATVNGSQIVLTYDVGLASSTPAQGSYSVDVSRIRVGVESLAVSGPTVTITLEVPVEAGQIVEVAHDPPETSPLTSAGGTAAVRHGLRATNMTAVTVPQLQSASVDGAHLQLVFDERLDAGSPIAEPARQRSSYIVTVDSVRRQVVDEWIAGAVVHLLLESPVVPGQSVTFRYARSSATVAWLRYFRMSGGTKVAPIRTRSVENVTPVPVPEVWDAHVDGTRLVVVFSRELGAADLLGCDTARPVREQCRRSDRVCDRGGSGDRHRDAVDPDQRRRRSAELVGRSCAGERAGVRDLRRDAARAAGRGAGRRRHRRLLR